MIEITVDQKELRAVTSALRAARDAMTGDQSLHLMEQAGEAARVTASEYHDEYDAQGNWKGERYLGGSPRAGAFAARIAKGWFLGEVTKDSASIVNNAEHYAFKVRGGKITPKRARFLTIPMIREAAGLHVRDYIRITGRKLFRPGRKREGSRLTEGRMVLSEMTTQGLRNVYALKASVTQRPWPNALPSEDRIATAFVTTYKKELLKLLKA